MTITEKLPHPVSQNRPKLGLLLLVWLINVVLIFTTRQPLPFPRPNFPRATPVWGTRPLLGYFVLTPSLAHFIHQAGILNDSQIEFIKNIAIVESEQLRLLEQETLSVINDPTLSLEQKRQEIERMGYNQRVMATIQASEKALVYSLNRDSYQRFVDWIEQRWQVEVALHGKPALSLATRTYQVYATRYDSGGAYTVALPDKCLKFANGGNHICDSDGYSVGQRYSVYISYKKGASVLVGEAGPWNVDDNYWARLNDPQPRRMFADLGLGMPEAQAAYFNGYNGGLDQFGRKVTAPYGIDLARQVSIDIGLQPGVNDWINVSFLWTESWGSGSWSSTPGSAEPTRNEIQPVETSTPNPDGSLTHIVQPGQALWSIAIAYGTTIRDIQQLNDLGESSVVFVGQELLIRPAGSFLTPTSGEGITQTATVAPTLTASPSATVERLTPTEEQKPSPPEETAQSVDSENRRQLDPLLLAIFFLVAGGIGLWIAGHILKK